MAKQTTKKSPLLHLFDPKFPPSVANLDPALTINGSTVYPTFRYKGGDANDTDWKPWGYGETLTLTEAWDGSPDPYLNRGSHLMGSATIDDSVEFYLCSYYRGPAGFAQIGTNDFVLEFIFSRVEDYGYWIGTYDDWGDAAGWELFGSYDSKGFNTWAEGDGAGDCWNVPTNDTIVNTMVHVMWIYDASGSAVCYVDGVASNVDDVSTVGDLTVADTFYLGGMHNGVQQKLPEINIYYAALWDSPAWLDTHLQQALVDERFSKLTGTYPQQARGTALPSVATRDSVAFIEKLEANGTTKLYSMGKNWIRHSSAVDANGADFSGVSIESSDTNHCLQSIKPATAPWISSGAVPPVENTVEVTAPDGTSTAALFDAGDNAYQFFSVSAAVDFSLAFWIRKKDNLDNDQGIQVLNAASVSNGQWFINPSELPDSQWVLITRNSTYLKTVPYEFTGHVSGSSGIWIKSHTGTPAFYIWNPQVILSKGLYYYSSAITTGAATVTRETDILKYDSTGVLTDLLGSIRATVCFPYETTLLSNTYRKIVAIQDVGGDNAAMIQLKAGVPYVSIYEGGVSKANKELAGLS